MNIKKKLLYLELSPVTYQGKQYTCIASGRKNFIFWIVRIIILIIAAGGLFIYQNLLPDILGNLIYSLLLLGYTILLLTFHKYVLIGALGIELDCCIFSIENENHDKVKVFQTKTALFWGDWNDIVKTSDYEHLTKLIFKEYNIYQEKEFELNRKKNWDGIISLEKTEVKGATDNDNRNYYG